MEAERSNILANELDKIVQVGIVVEDVDVPVAGMREIFGVEPDFVREFKYPEVFYRGEKVDSWARIASFTFFGIELEFMEPRGGDSIWRDFLRENPSGHALHHLRFTDVEDNDAVSAKMAERGVEVYQEGASISNPGGKFTYYDTMERLGFITEVVTRKKD